MPSYIVDRLCNNKILAYTRLLLDLASYFCGINISWINTDTF